jgi:bifunctional DNA-binding transcriptional regulator/antitoxin component of YhaV-PrlF toxin-antitoxin module
MVNTKIVSENVVSCIRKLDSLGRTVIPKEIRTVLGWTEKTHVNIYLYGNTIIVSTDYQNITSTYRKIDSLGRIVIPKEFRIILQWPDSVHLNIFSDGMKVYITKFPTCCSVCNNQIGSDSEFLKINDSIICLDCISAIEAQLKK